MSNQPSQPPSSLQKQVNTLELEAANAAIEAREKALDEREAKIKQLIIEEQRRLDTQIAHKEALLTNLTNQTASAENALTEARERSERQISELEAEAAAKNTELEGVKLEIEAQNIALAESQRQLDWVDREIDSRSETINSLEQRIVELKHAAQVEQSANKEAIDELSRTISDLLDQQRKLQQEISGKQTELAKIDIQITNDQRRYSDSEADFNQRIAELTERHQSLTDAIARQENRLQASLGEEQRRTTEHVTRKKELDIRQKALDERAKELGYKERKIQSDLSLR